MRILFFFILSFSLSFASPLTAKPNRKTDPVESLQREVVEIFKNNPIQFDGTAKHEVTVGFLINAKNEIIILDVNGENEPACNFVKRVLNYRKIKYAQSRQLIRYSIKIHLVGDEPIR